MSEEQQAFVPIEEKEVDFYGDTIPAAPVELNGQSQIYLQICPPVGFEQELRQHHRVA